MAAEAPGLVRIANIEGKGRGLVASQPLRAGQILLRDSPILLYSASPLLTKSQVQAHQYCSNCFRKLPNPLSDPISCSSCSAALFCSVHCKSAAVSSSHTTWICQSLQRLGPALDLHHHDRRVQARFLVAAYNLAVVSPPHFKALLSLQGEPEPYDDDAPFLHSLISTLCPPLPVNPSEFGFGFSPDLTAALLAKDKLNAFGLMEPFDPDKERSVRAYGIYPLASLFNHDCLPNACRFDYVDTDSPGRNTDMVVRAIHDLPAGREVCLSYFPVNLRYSERQTRLKEDYGFVCDCDRCKVEATWSDQEDEVSDNEAAMDEDEDEDMEADDDEGRAESDFPHAYFFLRYMCSRDNCWGTLAPLPPTDAAAESALMECNVCGNLSNSEGAVSGSE